jgi:hypothetical protein
MWMLTDAEPAYVLEPMYEDRANIERPSKESLDRYYQVTGYDESNIAAVAHHVISLYGPSCRACGKPLRTPRAKMSAACGVFQSHGSEFT